jgi:hypothetical protein
MQFGIQATFGAADQTASLVAESPFFASIITVFGTAASEARPSIIRTKMPLSPHRFRRLYKVSGGPFGRIAPPHGLLPVSCDADVGTGARG